MSESEEEWEDGNHDYRYRMRAFPNPNDPNGSPIVTTQERYDIRVKEINDRKIEQDIKNKRALEEYDAVYHENYEKDLPEKRKKMRETLNPKKNFFDRLDPLGPRSRIFSYLHGPNHPIPIERRKNQALPEWDRTERVDWQDFDRSFYVPDVDPKERARALTKARSRSRARAKNKSRAKKQSRKQSRSRANSRKSRKK